MKINIYIYINIENYNENYNKNIFLKIYLIQIFHLQSTWFWFIFSEVIITFI